jgi:hypothetical protein
MSIWVWLDHAMRLEEREVWREKGGSYRRKGSEWEC